MRHIQITNCFKHIACISGQSSVYETSLKSDDRSVQFNVNLSRYVMQRAAKGVTMI